VRICKKWDGPRNYAAMLVSYAGERFLQNVDTPILQWYGHRRNPHIGAWMRRKRIVQLAAFVAIGLLAVALISGIGCSDDDAPIVTPEEAESLVCQHLESNLHSGGCGWLVPCRNRLQNWEPTATYLGDHAWKVCTPPTDIVKDLGCWTVYERTKVVEPANDVAKSLARDHFK